MSYWSLVEPIWDTVSIYHGADVFLDQYASAPEASRVLFAAHWCQSEIKNGGFEQFFENSTGVLAPEGVKAFQIIGMPQTAATIEKAMSLFGPNYPRDRSKREETLETICDTGEEDDLGPLGDLDEIFFSLIDTENGGFEFSADEYAKTNG